MSRREDSKETRQIEIPVPARFRRQKMQAMHLQILTAFIHALACETRYHDLRKGRSLKFFGDIARLRYRYVTNIGFFSDIREIEQQLSYDFNRIRTYIYL